MVEDSTMAAKFRTKKLPSRRFDSVNFLVLRGDTLQFIRDSPGTLTRKFLSAAFLKERERRERERERER